MIKLKTISVSGFDGAIQGMRYPMNSDNLSDSYYLCAHDDVGVARPYEFKIGEKDLELAKKLANAGSDHGKFLRMIHVQVSVTAPILWWKEADTYKVATTTNSRSTMHKIHSRDLTLDDFSHENMNNNHIQGVTASSIVWLRYTICMINSLRKMFIETKDKEYWRQIIDALPESYNQEECMIAIT